MIDSIGNSQKVNPVRNNDSNQNGINFHNASPKDLENYFTGKMKTGEISLKEALPFISLDISKLEEQIGKQISLKYGSRVWDNPNTKRDMIKEYKAMLEDMKLERADQKSVDMIRRAIELMEKFNKNSSFSNILNEEMQKA